MPNQTTSKRIIRCRYILHLRNRIGSYLPRTEYIVHWAKLILGNQTTSISIGTKIAISVIGVLQSTDRTAGIGLTDFAGLILTNQTTHM